MAGTTLDLNELLSYEGGRDSLANSISRYWMEWEMYRNSFMNQRVELRNYLYATDTTTTSNRSLPWKNSTTVPKLTQIADNLKANYMAALFPSQDWLIWEGDSEADEAVAKRQAIQAYMRTKLRQDRAEVTVGRLIDDYIREGNVFATAEWVDESIPAKVTALATTETIRGYVGPRIIRISMNDIVFNPTAPRFEQAPKIIKAIKTLGELKKMAMKMPPDSDEGKMLRLAVDKSANVRRAVGMMTQGDVLKSEGFQVDGFSSMQNYWTSDNVEVLTFYGDLYDVNSGEFIENAVVTIMDRSWVISKKTNPNWTTQPGIFHAGWRTRPDNLYAMGPLDNLVGMQYRIDHLENLKADVFDLIAYPIQMIIGHVEDYTYAPGTKIICGDEGKVEFLTPPDTALNADMQIMELERRMEELAGAPKEAMGIRSPGEKTKFEVQKLDNAASRIFQNKIEHFQDVFFEPLINYCLALSRQNMSASDVTRTLDSEVDAVVFSTVTRDDITANGSLRPVGAQHFAEKANALQNLVTLSQSPAWADQSVAVHISGKKLAQMMVDLAGFEKQNLYSENIRVIEQMETQQLTSTAGEAAEVQAATPPGLTQGDPESGPTG